METTLVEQRQHHRDRKIAGWFAEYGQRLLRFIRSRLDDLDTAEDVAQDVWFQLTRQDDLDNIERIGSWLFTAANNRIINQYKRRRDMPFSRLAARSDPDADAGEAADDLSFDRWIDENLPDELVESREFWQILYAALDELPVEQREVFIAHELYEIPFKELAARSGVPLNTLLARKRYAVLHLRRVLEHYLNG
jgi:RNA polymerase sigma factor (sigma-70 family)